MEKTTSWGGQHEIIALSHVLRRNILVFRHDMSQQLFPVGPRPLLSWSLQSAVWTLEFGVWSVEFGVRALDSSLFTPDSSLLTLDS